MDPNVVAAQQRMAKEQLGNTAIAFFAYKERILQHGPFKTPEISITGKVDRDPKTLDTVDLSIMNEIQVHYQEKDGAVSFDGTVKSLQLQFGGQYRLDTMAVHDGWFIAGGQTVFDDRQR